MSVSDARPVTLITGTRKGIGEFLARHYVARGHCVIGCSRTRPEWSLQNYHHFEIDVTDEVRVRELFSMVRREFGSLHNLINNAGIASMNHALLTPIDTLRRVLDTNVIGTFLFCREAAKLMQRTHRGRIVNFSTVAVPLKVEGEAAYVAAKSAVQALTLVLAREFAPYGITVNAVGPTPIETDLIRAVPATKIEKLLSRQAIPRMGTRADIANVCDFFLAESSDFVTGQVLFLGGV